MSTHAATRIPIELAEAVAREFAAAVRNRRIYAPDHQRVRCANDSFVAALNGVFQSESRLLLTDGGDLLAHEGVPLSGIEGPARDLARLLRERRCGGVVFRAGFHVRSLFELLDWLAAREPGPNPVGLVGVRLLPPGAEEQLRDAEEEEFFRRVPEFEVPLRLQHSAARVLEHVLEDLRAGRRVDLKEVRDLAVWAADAARDEGSGLLAATQRAGQDRYTFGHAANVFLVSSALLEPLTGDARELARLCEAALLHDAGKSRVPRELLHKPEKLTREEMELMRRHPELGAEALARTGEVDALAVEVAYCHHMRADGHGYPVPTLPIRPGPVSSIVQAADMFEAVTARRGARGPLTPVQAAGRILRVPGMPDRSPALSLLMRRLTGAPPGAEVTLESGEHCLVLRAFPDAPETPLVRVLTDTEGRRLRSPSDLDLREPGPDDGKRIRAVHLKPGIARKGPEADAILRETIGDS